MPPELAAGDRGTLAARAQRLAPVAVVASGVALSAYALATVEPLDQPVVAALDLAVGWAFVAAGLAVASVPRAGRVAAIGWAVGLTWFPGGILYRGPLVQLLLAGVDGRLRGRVAITVVAFGYLDVLLETIWPAEFLWLSGGLGVATIVAAVFCLRGTRGAVRRTRLISAAAAIAIVSTLAVGAWAERASRLDRAVTLVAFDVVLIATAIVIALDRRWRGWSRAAVTGLVVDLGSRSDAGTLRQRLATVLGDPSLQVAYRLEADSGYVGEAGEPLELPTGTDGRAVTPITSRGEELGALIHDPAVLTDTDLAGPVVAAAGLAVANARLQSDIRRRTDEVEASRRRIVMAGDRQRQRIEGDLRQGVLARLDAVGMQLGGLAPDGVTMPPEVATVIETLELARDELRRFARGLYPPALAEQGLPGAVAELVGRSPVPVTLTLPSGRFSAEIEVTGYFVCAEALTNVAKHAAATRVEINGSVDDGWLRMAIADDGMGGADADGSGLRGLAARVEAAGGRLLVVSPPGHGTRIEAELPLGELGLG